MNKKLAGSVIAIIAIVSLVIAVLVTRPESGSNNTKGSTSNSPDTSQTTDEEVATSSVAIKDFDYSPGTITVKKGTTVTWTNEDSVEHTVTGTDGGPDSELFGQGKSYSFTFNEVGTFDYFCKPHPSMVGKVIVE